LEARSLFGGHRSPLRELAARNLVPRPTPSPARWFQRMSERFDVPRVEWFARSDVLFAPNFVPPPTRSRRLVVTVHDLASRLFPDVRLVIAGSGVEWNQEGPVLLQKALDSLPPEARRRVVRTGYVSEGDKVALLSGAGALVYPSLYEGFGLPVLEAMACGTP